MFTIALELGVVFDGLGLDGFGFERLRTAIPMLEGFGFDGFGFDGLGLEGFGFDGFGFDGLGFDGLGFDGLGVLRLEA